MSKIRHLMLAIMLSLGLSLGACTTTVTEYRFVTPEIQIVQKPTELNIKNVTFDQDKNLITLTMKSYENLIHNLTEILRKTKTLENIVDYYEKSISELNNIENSVK